MFTFIPHGHVAAKQKCVSKTRRPMKLDVLDASPFNG